MYIPEAFAEDNLERLHSFIRTHSFGMLVTVVPGGGMTASHIPFLLDPAAGQHGKLLGHVARANPQWRSFAEGAEALVVFQGPDAYISPSWYADPMSVPTWNYVAVHAHGRPEVTDDPAAVRRFLEALVATYEAGRRLPWSLDRLPQSFVEKLAQGIVTFEMPINRLEGKAKLSQNRTKADVAGAIAGLRSEPGPNAHAIAALMEGTQ